MKIAFGVKKPLSSYYSVPSEGQFALEPEPSQFASLHWDHCREQFLGKFKKDTPGFYFSHKQNCRVNIAGFILKFEEIIRAENAEVSPTIFCETERDTAMWIEPNSFWRNCIMKKSLFTLLLRCASNYDVEKDNFDDAIFGCNYKENKYARETKSAIMRFLFGFTKFAGTLTKSVPTISGNSTLIRHGWHAEFDRNSIYEVRRKLVRPIESNEVSLVGVESLWG